MAQGCSAGLASVAGITFGNLRNALGASIHLAALFTISSRALLAVKYAGAAYLFYLGVKVLRASQDDVKRDSVESADLPRIFRDSLIVALLNPKTIVFFVAFLPLFIRPESSPMLQSALLGAMFVIIAATTDTAYALAASALGPAFAKHTARTVSRYLTAGALIGFSLFTAASGPRSTK